MRHLTLGFVMGLGVVLLAFASVTQPLRRRDGGRRQFQDGLDPSFSQSSRLAKMAEVQKTLGVPDDLDKRPQNGMMDVPLEQGRLLGLLTETVNARNVVEGDAHATLIGAVKAKLLSNF